MTQAFQLEIGEAGIATLTFDLPDEKVNKFSLEAMSELDQLVDSLKKRSDIQALILKSGKPGMFIAGADIQVLQTVSNRKEGLEKSRAGHDIFNKWEQLPFPTTALIDGACLGGGMELALACTYRVVTDHPKTQLGLPEVNLGIIPGWGGTQRLPQLIGLSHSLPIILGGKPVAAKKALKLRLADHMINHEFQDQQVLSFVQSTLCTKEKERILKKRQAGGVFSYLLEGNSLGRQLLFKKAKESLIKKTGGHYPAPLAALQVIEDSVGVAQAEGLQKEQQHFADLAHSAVSKNLIQIFFTSEELKKEATKAQANGSSTIESTAVLGGGVMGGGIAWLMSKGKLPVRVKDISWDGVAKAFQQASKVYGQLKKIRKITANEAKYNMHLISGTLDYQGFKNHDLIVEAVVENLDLKKQVLADLENHIREDAIVCSNTSTFSITEMASAMQHPERFVGMHFFNPVNRMPLVEIIPGEKTHPEAVSRAVALMQKVGKTPVVVKDCQGFLVNRILFPYLNEALFLLHEGGDFQKIDKVIEGFGMPMGPFVLNDEVGLDTACKAAKSIQSAYGERMKTLPHTSKLVEAGFLGKKSGKGFYIHGKGKKRTPNPQVKSLLDQSTPSKELSAEEIMDRCMLAMVNESSRCLEEGIVEKAPFLDMAMIMGTGFPPFRGGPLRYADSLGLKEVVSRLKKLENIHGIRFKPSDLLVSLAEAGKTFYTY